MNWENFINWTGSSSIARIILIVIVTWVVYLMLKNFVKNILKIAINKGVYQKTTDTRFEKRINTITSVISKTILVVLIFVAALMILAEFNVNITPILTGAGVAGLAIGFGAQHLVRDVISGFFILIEDQFARGDVVEIAGKSGTVKDINLRRTILRDLSGNEHIIPNGEINIATNKTKRWSKINLNIPVAYETNIDKAIEVIGLVATDLSKDKNFSDFILEPIECWGVNDFADSAILLKTVGKVKASKQWKVAREFRRRIKIAFDKEKIEIPYPHVKIIK